MAKDLPNRPKRDPSGPVKKVSPTDRVRARTDKLDPRFEAARRKLDRDEERRARAEATRRARRAQQVGPAGQVEEEGGGAEFGPVDEEVPAAAPATKKKGFSFGQISWRRNGGEATDDRDVDAGGNDHAGGNKKDVP